MVSHGKMLTLQEMFRDDSVDVVFVKCGSFSQQSWWCDVGCIHECSSQPSRQTVVFGVSLPNRFLVNTSLLVRNLSPSWGT